MACIRIKVLLVLAFTILVAGPVQSRTICASRPIHSVNFAMVGVYRLFHGGLHHRVTQSSYPKTPVVISRLSQAKERLCNESRIQFSLPDIHNKKYINTRASTTTDQSETQPHHALEAHKPDVQEAITLSSEFLENCPGGTAQSSWDKEFHNLPACDNCGGAIEILRHFPVEQWSGKDSIEQIDTICKGDPENDNLNKGCPCINYRTPPTEAEMVGLMDCCDPSFDEEYERELKRVAEDPMFFLGEDPEGKD
ncbi:hypothetical protein BJ875DRAFT_499474 [Amylocarpus encephaloides]|uniref:Uncharacterized protein n=1 Tax=Amylocarpus encephaloides TaxID=45428 RepID=A0A9P8C1J6_9HELO|nr:hypothetical protein BJ875DRAFT_499474 [Amylocarpus encephaloides]